MCISNMLAKAGEFGCAPTDVECLCGTFDFVMGVHDCTLEACGPDALTGLDGVNMCEGCMLTIGVLVGTLLTVHPRRSPQ
jgi:hypothetical protein